MTEAVVYWWRFLLKRPNSTWVTQVMQVMIGNFPKTKGQWILLSMFAKSTYEKFCYLWMIVIQDLNFRFKFSSLFLTTTCDSFSWFIRHMNCLSSTKSSDHWKTFSLLLLLWIQWNLCRQSIRIARTKAKSLSHEVILVCWELWYKEEEQREEHDRKGRRIGHYCAPNRLS